MPFCCHSVAIASLPSPYPVRASVPFPAHPPPLFFRGASEEPASRPMKRSDATKAIPHDRRRCFRAGQPLRFLRRPHQTKPGPRTNSESHPAELQRIVLRRPQTRPPQTAENTLALSRTARNAPNRHENGALPQTHQRPHTMRPVSHIRFRLAGAEKRTRTSTPLRVRGPEPRASANSAISAHPTNPFKTKGLAT